MAVSESVEERKKFVSRVFLDYILHQRLRYTWITRQKISVRYVYDVLREWAVLFFKYIFVT